MGGRLLTGCRRVASWLVIEVAARLLYYSGVLYVVARIRRRWGRPRLLVPMYHRVRGGGQGAPAPVLEVERGVSPDLFQRHLRVFAWFGPLLRLSDAYAQLHERQRVSRTLVAVTFDDGYRDNVTEAFPILRHQAATATVFPVVRTASGGRPLWWDELAEVLRRAGAGGPSLQRWLSELVGAGLSELAPAAACNGQAARCLEQCLVALPDSERRRVLDQLVAHAGSGWPARWAAGLYADWDELSAMTTAGIELGGHTVDHVILDCEPPSEAAWQIAACRRVLEHGTGRPVRCFAYPNGSHNAAVRELVRRAGFQIAVTAEHGVNYEDTDPYRLYRMPIGRERPFHLAFKLAFYGLVHRRSDRRVERGPVQAVRPGSPKAMTSAETAPATASSSP